MAYFWGVGMSVINQMLKDLDKRQNEQQEGANLAMTVPAKISSSKLMLIIVAIIIIVNVIGIFGWQLYSENQQLRSQVQQESVALTTEKYRAETKVNKVISSKGLLTKDRALALASTAINPALEDNDARLNSTQSSAVIVGAQEKNALAKARVKMTENENLRTKVTEKNIAADSTVKVEVAKQVTQPEQVNRVEQTKPSLTISRSQLSPKALAENKITQAEQAMERHDLAKAESLFEEVLLIVPEHETARKQLAALWYGKRYYQDAINLLSQGIALAPQGEEMRLMSARIYYEQGQARQAYNILSPVKQSTSTELQALLANTATELNEHDNAIMAYQNLIALEPDMGRWWLGMAVSLDSLGKFVLARDAYKQALARNNLSSSAMQFARQRLIELGE